MEQPKIKVSPTQSTSRWEHPVCGSPARRTRPQAEEQKGAKGNAASAAAAASLSRADDDDDERERERERAGEKVGGRNEIGEEGRAGRRN